MVQKKLKFVDLGSILGLFGVYITGLMREDVFYGNLVIKQRKQFSKGYKKSLNLPLMMRPEVTCR